MLVLVVSAQQYELRKFEQHREVVRNLFIEGSQIKTYDFVRAALKKFDITKLTHFVLLQNELCYTKY